MWNSYEPKSILFHPITPVLHLKRCPALKQCACAHCLCRGVIGQAYALDHTHYLLDGSLALYWDDSTNFLQDACVTEWLVLSKPNTPHFLSADLGITALTYSAEFSHPLQNLPSDNQNKILKPPHIWTHCNNSVLDQIPNRYSQQKLLTNIELKAVFWTEHSLTSEQDLVEYPSSTLAFSKSP